MKKYLTGIVPPFTLIMLLSYFYASLRLPLNTFEQFLLAIPFVLVWIIPVRFWSTDRSSYKTTDHLLHVLGYICMGLVNFLIVSLLLADISLLAWPSFVRANYEHIVYGLTGIALTLGLIKGHYGPAIKEEVLVFQNLPKDLQGLKIAQISDLHVGPTLRKNYVEKVVQKTLNLKPDLIVLTGDIVDGKISQLKDDVAPLERLCREGKAYFIMGNHDYYSGANQWIDQFQKMGMKILLNTHDLIPFNSGNLMLAGVTDPAAGMANHPRPNPQEAKTKHFQNKSGESFFKIMLAHNPKLAALSAAAGFDLMLSGHTHAGQFYPWTLIVRKVHKPHYWGQSLEGKMRVYVSAGTGTWGPPIRLGTKTELTLLKLTNADLPV
jgi:predicted MPP superfamily phosphohydrolase